MTVPLLEKLVQNTRTCLYKGDGERVRKRVGEVCESGYRAQRSSLQLFLRFEVVLKLNVPKKVKNDTV